MNRENLDRIFGHYIEKFDLLNNEQNDENFKWSLCADFHTLMDPDGEHFVEGIHEAVVRSRNLVDGSSRYCFKSLARCAELDEKAVRDLFRALFRDDGGDLKLRQKKIDVFLRNSNALIRKYVSTYAIFKNDQRTAMCYLFLNDPEHHYLHKAHEVRAFAPRAGFFGDFGTYTDFRMDVFYDMCDRVAACLPQCPELMKVHRSRYFDADGNPVPGLHPDTNYHILLADIIHGCPKDRYNFIDDVPLPLHPVEIIRAQDAHERMERARADLALSEEAKAFYEELLRPGAAVHSRGNGDGEIIRVSRNTITVHFPSAGKKEKEKKVSYLAPASRWGC